MQLSGGKEVEISITGRVDNQNVVKVYPDKYGIEAKCTRKQMDAS